MREKFFGSRRTGGNSAIDKDGNSAICWKSAGAANSETTTVLSALHRRIVSQNSSELNEPEN